MYYEERQTREMLKPAGPDDAYVVLKQERIRDDGDHEYVVVVDYRGQHFRCVVTFEDFQLNRLGFQPTIVFDRSEGDG